MFQISENKKDKVVDLGCWCDGCWVWSLRWRRSLFAWEEELLEEFLLVINQVELRSDSEDRWLWIHNPDGSFSKSAYLKIQSLNPSLDNPSVPSNNVFFQKLWSSLVPLKVLTFS